MSTHHRTWQTHHVANVLVTVELDPIADTHCMVRHRGLADLTKRLVEGFDALRLPVTWAVNDPTYSAATSLVIRSAVPHELAILGDPNWLGPTAGRTRFARELARRVSQGRAAGINIRSLVPRVESIKRHIDLVIKQQITAVAGVELPPQVAYPWPTPHALHYGVWEIPVTDRLPRRSLWFLEGGWSALRKIGRAARDAATGARVIDVPALEQEGHRARNRSRGSPAASPSSATAASFKSRRSPAPPHASPTCPPRHPSARFFTGQPSK